MSSERYYFSVIMAIYNAEEYLHESIQSVLKQTLNFEKHVQLILVNDGSNDNSGKICAKYAEKYPQNIIFINKENGGVSSARNAGLDVAAGKYINFLDSDDKLSANALEKVFHFFENKGNKIDVVSIPIFWFDQAKGKHLLNYKYKSNRIINILQEYRSIQMSASSSFVRRSAVGNLRFNEKLKYGEDAEWLNHIILDKCEYGVVANAKYLYRKRKNLTSATQTARSDKDYYLQSLVDFSHSLINISIQKLGFVPRYIQYMLMYDLQWRLNNNNLEPIMSAEEVQIYLSKLKELLQYIDDDIILTQNNLNIIRKDYLLALKHGTSFQESYQLVNTTSNSFLINDTKIIDTLNKHKLAIELIRIENEFLIIEGHFTSLFDNRLVDFFAKYNEKIVKAETFDRFHKNINVFGKKLKEAIGLRFKVPLSSVNKDQLEISFYASIKDNQIPLNIILASKTYLSGKPAGYYYKEGFLVTLNKQKGHFIVKKSGSLDLIKKEFGICKSLFKMNKIGSRKAIFVRFLYLFIKHFKKKPIWLFMDRVNKADDNAEVLFEYANLQNDGVNKYFVINEDCEDYERLKKIGKVIKYGSRKHKLYMLLADKMISSHADEFILNPFGKMKKYYQGLLNFDFVFLQHGITKDDISSWLNKYSKNIRLFITAAKQEYDSIVNGHYNYEEKEVILSGFPRFDKLKDMNEKRILIMPTWRSNLVSKINPLTGKRAYNPHFKESLYFKAFNDLLNSTTLINTAKNLGYKIVFFPHPNIMQQLTDFQIDPSIEVADINSRYRDHFNKSSLLVTDYSSVAFDFAYLKKPVIYYHFETNHLEEGYFDYHTMGFGDVLSNGDEVVQRIVDYLKSDCRMEEKYIERVNQFYSYTDNHNCERVYNAIVKVGNNKVN